ncbi:hypothetical protein BIW11_09488, partial [Tropilaelaps mercedesae]
APGPGAFVVFSIYFCAGRQPFAEYASSRDGRQPLEHRRKHRSVLFWAKSPQRVARGHERRRRELEGVERIDSGLRSNANAVPTLGAWELGGVTLIVGFQRLAGRPAALFGSLLLSGDSVGRANTASEHRSTGALECSYPWRPVRQHACLDAAAVGAVRNDNKPGRRPDKRLAPDTSIGLRYQRQRRVVPTAGTTSEQNETSPPTAARTADSLAVNGASVVGPGVEHLLTLALCFRSVWLVSNGPIRWRCVQHLTSGVQTLGRANHFPPTGLLEKIPDGSFRLLERHFQRLKFLAFAAEQAGLYHAYLCTHDSVRVEFLHAGGHYRTGIGAPGLLTSSLHSSDCNSNNVTGNAGRKKYSRPIRCTGHLRYWRSHLEWTATAIKCYKCNSYSELYCSENWSLGDLAEEIQPEECDDTYEAQYCVKTTGMYQGEIGTRRFCSAKHLGNYCDWNSRPGDLNENGQKREYRACIYTCATDGCNSALRPAASSLGVLALLAVLYAIANAG